MFVVAHLLQAISAASATLQDISFRSQFMVIHLDIHSLFFIRYYHFVSSLICFPTYSVFHFRLGLFIKSCYYFLFFIFIFSNDTLPFSILFHSLSLPSHPFFPFCHSILGLSSKSIGWIRWSKLPRFPTATATTIPARCF